MDDGSFLADLFREEFKIDHSNTYGFWSVSDYGPKQAIERLTAYLNKMRKEGYIIKEIKTPKIEMLGGCITITCFVLWVRKPMAEAIYG